MGARYSRRVASPPGGRAVLFGGALGPTNAHSARPRAIGNLSRHGLRNRPPSGDAAMLAGYRALRQARRSGAGRGLGIRHSVGRQRARRRGCVIGCDIDPDAVRIARERVAVPMFVGSVEAVRSEWADVIVANIDAATLERIATELKRVGKPGVDADCFRLPGVGPSRRIFPAGDSIPARVALLRLLAQIPKKKPTELATPWAKLKDSRKTERGVIASWLN